MKTKIYLAKRGAGIAEFAQAIGVTYETARRIVNNGDVPLPKTVRRIQEWSEGKIKLTDLYHADDQAGAPI